MEIGETGMPGALAASLVILVAKPELAFAIILHLPLAELPVLVLILTPKAATLKLVLHLVR